MQLLSRSAALSWLITAGCASGPRGPTITEEEHKARHYAATADSIEVECFKSRRNELTVDAPSPCWKGEDVRFLEANRNAAAAHRANAARMRSLSASR